MAITKITAPSSIPATVADYQAQNSHLMAFINQINSQAFILSDPNGTVAPTIKQGAYISHGGSLYIVDTADATISGTPSDGTVYVRVSGTDTLTAEYITDISSYAWNSAYNAMISGSYTLLPYMLIKSGTSWTKYRFEQHKQSLGTFKSLNVADNITLGGTVDGHDIDGELDTLNGRVNQGVKTTDSPTFANATISERRMVYAPHSSGAKGIFTAQYSSLRGLTSYNGDIYEADGASVHKHDGISSTILSTITLPYTVYAICFIGGDLVASNPDTVYRYNGFSTSLLSSFSHGNYVNGIAWDGTDLWIIDYGSRSLDHHSGFSSTQIESISLAPILESFGITSFANVSGLVWTGENFIFSIGLNVGSSDWNICALSADNSYVVDAYNAYTDVSNNHVSGLALMDNFLYFGNYDTSTPQLVHRIPIRRVW